LTNFILQYKITLSVSYQGLYHLKVADLPKKSARLLVNSLITAKAV